MREADNPRVTTGPSRIEGTGAFAAEPIRARRKIGEIEGERIRQSEARRRARAGAQQHQPIAIVELGDGWAIDATRNRGAMRYINHSCSPNTFIRICYGRVEFYALRDIAAGEELTADYGETHHEGKLPCRCGSPNCRGAL
jgi:SET domain-containing protein